MRGLYVTAGITMAGVSSVFALLAELEERYNLSKASLGWIAGSAFVAALIAQLWLSRYADRGYAAVLLRSGVVMSAAGLLWFAAATELWQFIAARALLGAGVGVLVPPARRAIVLSADGNQGERLGVFYASYLSGFVFGPPVAAALTELADVRLPFLVLGILVLLSVIPASTVAIPEADPDSVPRNRADRRVMRRLLRSRKLIAALLVVISFRYSIGVFEPLWATHLDDLGASTRLIGFSLMSFALPMLLVAKPAGRVSDRIGSRWASLIPALVTVPLMATYGYSPYVWIILVLAVPHGLMEAMLSPASQAAIADATTADDTAAAQGLGEAAGSAAAAIGAFSAPWLFGELGAGPAWLIAAFAMAAINIASWVLDPPLRESPDAGRGARVDVAPPATIEHVADAARVQ